MTLLDTFERKGLFRLTRFLALLIVLCLLVGAAIGMATVYTRWPKQAEGLVPARDVLSKMQATSKTEPPPLGEQPKGIPSDEHDELQGLTIPKTLETEFTPLISRPGYDSFLIDPESRVKNRKVLAGRMNSLTLSRNEQQVYINEMALAVELAEANKLDRVDAINEYMDLKQERVSAFRAHEEAAKEMRLWAAGTVVAVLLLTALFSLVLVLLAIERNTRAPTQNA